MTGIVATYLPDLSELAGLGALAVVIVGFAVIGAAVAGARGQPDAMVLSGWAAAVTLFTAVGVTRAVPFTWIAVALLAAALVSAIALVRWRQWPLSAPLLRATAVSLPLVLLVASMAPSQWDEFTNWLPNARFLYEHDAFPGPGLPRNPSVFPAYPYALSLVIYLTSLLAGRLVENAVALFNLFLLLMLGVMVARIMRGALVAGRQQGGAAREEPALGWGWCALAALLATMLNPTFVHKIAFTAYADTGTAVALGFAAALGWKLLNALAEKDAEEARALAWQFGLAATALVSIKQVNLVLLVVLAGSIALVALRDPLIRTRALMRFAPAALALPLVVYAAWRIYVAINIPGGEFSIRPPSEWLIALIPDALARMALIAMKKGGYFSIMLVATAFAVRALWRMRWAFDRLALIAGGVFLGYNAFLLFAYVAAFGEGDARNAGSYWRYNMHLGGICVLFAGYGAALLWRRYLADRFGTRVVAVRLAGLAVALAVLLPVVLAGKLRFDLRPRYIEARSIAEQIAAALTPADRLLLLDLHDNGQYLVIMRYAVHGSAQLVGEINAFHGVDATKLSDIVRDVRPSHVWAYQPLPAVQGALNVSLADGASYLLRRTANGWAVMRNWPHVKGNGD